MKGLADDLTLECIRKTTPFRLAGEIDADACLLRIIDVCLELADLFIGAQEGFHPAYQRIHLLERSTTGHGSRDAEHGLVVAGEVAAFIYFLDEEAQRAAQSFVERRLDFLLPHVFLHQRIIGIDTQRVGMRIPFLVVVLDFLRQEKDRQAECQHQYGTGKFLPLAQQPDLPAVKPVEVKDGIREPRRMEPALRAVSGCKLHLLDQGRH